MGKLSFSDFELNKVFDFGFLTVSEREIIDFANQFDPLDFHTSKEVAEKSMFRGLITSGPHVFFLFYKRNWVPLFGNTVLAGLEVNNWKFLKPIYADMKVFCTLTIADIKPNSDGKTAAVKWHFDLLNEDNELFQQLDMTVLHKMRNTKKD